MAISLTWREIFQVPTRGFVSAVTRYMAFTASVVPLLGQGLVMPLLGLQGFGMLGFPLGLMEGAF